MTILRKSRIGSFAAAASIAAAGVLAGLVLGQWQQGAGLSPVLLAALTGATGLAAVLAASALRRQDSGFLLPLTSIAEVMEAMASSNLDIEPDHQHRDDEMGRMARALAVLRMRALEQRAAAFEQAGVVSAITTGLLELTDGNLAYRIKDPLPSDYEMLRESFNESLATLASLISGVAQSARQVNAGAGEIRSASDDLARRNEHHAHTLEKAVASLEAVTAIIGQSAQSAQDVQKAVGAAHSEAAHGGDVVSRATEAMAAIERSSAEITQIINVIDGIAFQTNLLALNAGVEAARAGESGKGFAVVANEVRALAQRSAEAAKDIKALIGTSSAQVGTGVALVNETGDLLHTIVTRVGEISIQIDQIAAGTVTQANNLAAVNSDIGAMDTITQQNSAMSEQATAAARSLAEEAGEMEARVRHFRTGTDQPAGRPLLRAVAPAISGNLALKIDDDDWSRF